MIPILRTPLGELYQADCLNVLKSLKPETVDLGFADPPFNLGKKYSSKIDDAKASHEYLDWCKTWLDGTIHVLKPGGSLFLWNLPKWNLPLGAYLEKRLTFRHWISVDIKYVDLVWSYHNTEVYRLLHAEDPKMTRSGESLYLKFTPKSGEKLSEAWGLASKFFSLCEPGVV